MKHVFLILLLVPLSVMATGATNNGGSGLGVGVGIGQGGNASSVAIGGGAVNAGNRQTSFVSNDNTTSLNNQTTYPRQHHNTPSFANFVPMGTAPCLVPFGGTGVGAGFGFGFSSSLKDENCMVNQSASVAAVNLGNKELATEIFCQGEYAKDTPTCMSLNVEQAEIKKQLGQQLAALKQQTEQTAKVLNQYRKQSPRRFHDASNWSGMHRH